MGVLSFFKRAYSSVKAKFVPVTSVVVVSAAVPAIAMAADGDQSWSSQIVTLINGTVATVSSIGLAILSIVVTIKTFVWARNAIRGG